MTHAVPEDDWKTQLRAENEELKARMDKLHWKTRLRAENEELKARMDKLHAFMQTKEFAALDTVERGDMLHQYTGMKTYQLMLDRRIKRLDANGS
jgi:hypothetical protein